MSAPAFTKERFYTEHSLKHGIASLQRHVNRYKWAASHLENGWDVLDAACGSGYGDPILLTVCEKVVGIDISPDAVNYAIKKRDRLKMNHRLHYIQCSVAEISAEIKNMKFDAVVSIETIEHVDERSQVKFLNGIKSVLKPNGVLLMTTPIKGTEPMTEYHVREFGASEFTSFLRARFSDVFFDSPEKFGVKDNFMLAVCRGAL